MGIGLLNGWPRVLFKLLGLVGYQAVRVMFGVVQTIYWSFNGTLQQLHESRRPENYDKCVQVMNVHAYYVFDILKTITREDFILTHNRFESPQFIFDNDHVSLMTLEEDGAVFVEAPQPGQHLWKTEFNSFVRFAQVQHGIRLFFVPNHAFHRMAEELGDPKHTLVFLYNSARCGSTLFTQMMEMTDCCVALSEPDVFIKLSQWLRERGLTKEVKEAFKSSISWLCRPYKNFQPKATVMKIMAPAIFALDALHELYPNSKHLFMYRGLEKNAKSIHRVCQELFLLKIAINLSKIHGYFLEASYNALGFFGKYFGKKLIDDIDFSINFWVVMCGEYVRLRASGFPTSAIRYEDIISDPEFAIQAILRYCDLPLSCTQLALRGLDVDSQRNSPFSRKILAQHADPELTKGAIERGNKLMKKYGLPMIESDGILEGTITLRPRSE